MEAHSLLSEPKLDDTISNFLLQEVAEIRTLSPSNMTTPN
ncbi:hypothetical protein FM120_03335 [Sphingobacterium faecium PCAi_F2.5]|nr:hypothetical protein FM120_03335 [Sphingobacterium faecium PCAi_F2.5]